MNNWTLSNQNMAAMSGGYLSPAELADLKDIWRQGYLFN